MKAHIARNQNAGVPLVLGWNLSPADRGKLEGMAPAFGMKVLLVSPADAGKTVAQLLGEVETKAPARWCWNRVPTRRQWFWPTSRRRMWTPCWI